MIKKYKYFTKVRNIRLLPARLLKFKKSKWSIVKRILVKRIHRSNSRKKHISNWSIAKKFIHKRNVLKNKIFELTDKKHSFLKRFRLGCSKKFFYRLTSNKFKRYFPVKGLEKSTKFFIKDKFKTSAKFGKFYYMSRLSKDKTRLKIKLKKFLNKGVLPTKNSFSEKESYIKSVYSDNFQLKGVLSSFLFFTNTSQINDCIRQGFLTLNDQKLNKFENLKSGDLVTVKSKIVSINKNKRKFVSIFSCASYLEADIYSQKIILLKDEKLSSKEDFHLASSEYVNIRKL